MSTLRSYDLADFPGSHALSGILKALIEAPHKADLQRDTIRLCRCEHGVTFLNIHRHRLFA